MARLEHTPSEHKGRTITVAHKRRIGHLLVVSGATSCGKKTLMLRLLANEQPELASRLGTPDGRVWGAPLNADKIAEPMEPARERIILHHDLMRPYLRSAMVHERDEALDILDTRSASPSSRLDAAGAAGPADHRCRDRQEAEAPLRAEARAAHEDPGAL